MGLEFARVALGNGQNVAATARNPQAVIDALGEHDNLLAVALDVTDIASIERAVQDTCTHFGGLDIVLNNAGYGIFGALEETRMPKRARFTTRTYSGP